MNLTAGQCSLFLCPSQYNFSVKGVSSLVIALQEIGLVSRKINTQQASNDFFTGERFLDFIAYMGCSPAIQFEASEKQSNFCHIRIHHYDSATLIVSQKHARAPHCPNCKKPVKNWPENKTVSSIFCEQCNTTSNIEAFDWRKMAGYAQTFIEISDIFPKEAIPQQLLLDKLNEIFGVEWLYFYACQ